LHCQRGAAGARHLRAKRGQTRAHARHAARGCVAPVRRVVAQRRTHAPGMKPFTQRAAQSWPKHNVRATHGHVRAARMRGCSHTRTPAPRHPCQGCACPGGATPRACWRPLSAARRPNVGCALAATYHMLTAGRHP
jgi:hypothetical protein